MNSQEGGPNSMSVATMPLTQIGKRLSYLFEAHHRRILKSAYRITGNLADAEDIAQSVFLRLANENGPPVKNEGSYLYRAGINGALDLLRRRKFLAQAPIEDAADVRSQDRSLEQELAGREAANHLRLAIAELPPRMAEMFTLRFLEDLGNREIATLMETSSAVVAVTLHQARSRLRKRLGEMERGKL